MVEYGMKPLDVLQSATSINAEIFHQPQLGNIDVGMKADIVVVNGDPTKNISDLRKIVWVMKDGVIYKP